MKGLEDKLGGEHLCTYYVLPLLQLSKFNFLSGNFINSFLCNRKEGWTILVKIGMTELLSKTLREGHPQYSCTMRDEQDYRYLAYDLPWKWHGDLWYFRQGDYSVMSAGAKEMIRTYSGLPNKVVVAGGDIESDVRLLALDRADSLRQWWNREYGREMDGELLPKPNRSMYIDWNILKTVKE